MKKLPKSDVCTFSILLTEWIIYAINGMNLSIKEEIIFKVFNWNRREWPWDMQANISLFLYLFMFGIVLWLTEALHICFKPTPVPIGFRPCESAYLFGQWSGGSESFKIGPCSITI